MKKLLVLLVALIISLSGCVYGSIPQIPLLPEFANSGAHSAMPPLPVEVGRIETYFSKQGQHPEVALNNLINLSTKTLDIAIYSLTYPATVKAITDAKKRGVVVRVVSDKTQAAGKSQTVAIDTLLLNNIPVKIDYHSGLMHLKMTVVDGQVATTGSYNYSTAATNDNDEILVIIYDVTFAQLCLGEFNRMWNDNTHYVNAVMSF